MQRLLLPLVFIVVDVTFLYWLWAHFWHWGIWDWDYHETVMEVARQSIVVHGELPLWNRYMGGGATLVGNPIARPFGPSMLPVLAFGTIPGVKIGVLLYLLIGQLGMYLLARFEGATRAAAALAAILLTLGGCYAQHVTHGHVDWTAFWWLPLVVLALHRSAAGWGPGTMLFGGLALALLLLDGGPYQLSFTMFFLACYAPLLALRERSVRPLVACGVIVAIAAGLAAVRLAPLVDNFLAFPRPTPADRNFYGMTPEPTAVDILVQGYLARAQTHDPGRWMPFVLNVGCYVGILPLLLAGVAAVRRFRDSWTIVVLLVLAVLVTLGPAAPVDLWALLHDLPGFSSLQVPARFNFFVLFAIALLAARGLDGLWPGAWPAARRRGWGGGSSRS